MLRKYLMPISSISRLKSLYYEQTLWILQNWEEQWKNVAQNTTFSIIWATCLHRGWKVSGKCSAPILKRPPKTASIRAQISFLSSLKPLLIFKGGKWIMIALQAGNLSGVVVRVFACGAEDPRIKILSDLVSRKLSLFTQQQMGTRLCSAGEG